MSFASSRVFPPALPCVNHCRVMKKKYGTRPGSRRGKFTRPRKQTPDPSKYPAMPLAGHSLASRGCETNVIGSAPTIMMVLDLRTLIP